MATKKITPEEVERASESMVSLLKASKSGMIDFEITRDNLKKEFGSPVVHEDKDGREVIHPKVRDMFKNKASKFAICDKSEKSWRQRRAHDNPANWVAE